MYCLLRKNLKLKFVPFLLLLFIEVPMYKTRYVDKLERVYRIFNQLWFKS